MRWWNLPFALPHRRKPVLPWWTLTPSSRSWWVSNPEIAGYQSRLYQLGVVIAHDPISGCPFVVRTVQTVLEDLGSRNVKSLASLGASRFTTN